MPPRGVEEGRASALRPTAPLPRCALPPPFRAAPKIYLKYGLSCSVTGDRCDGPIRPPREVRLTARKCDLAILASLVCTEDSATPTQNRRPRFRSVLGKLNPVFTPDRVLSA